MGRKFSSIGRVATVLVLSGAILAGTYAFTAANTVPNGKAGDGSGTVTGYVLSSVHYDLNATNPANIDAVTFTLDSIPAATSTIKAQLNAGSWYDCTNTGASVTCDTTSPVATVLAATSLRVVVAD
ncbi:MAG: hypothetical protein ACXWYN_09350 [Actinomycetota bacterium]